MATVDVIEIKDIQTLAGQELMNVYFYEVLQPGLTLEDYSDAFLADVMPAIRDAQTNDLVHTQLDVRSIYSPSATYTVFHTLPGTRFGTDHETLPRHDAFSFTLSGEDNSTRPGGKRLAGVAEDDQADGVISGTLATILGAIADAFVASLTAGGLADAMRPTIVKRVIEVVEGVTRYKLPETLVATVLNTIIDAGIGILVSTQNSRKR